MNSSTQLQQLQAEVDRLTQENKRLEQDKDKYKNLFDLSGDALSILDLNTGKFIECNDSAIELHGVKDRQHFLNLTPDQVSPEFQPNGKPSFDLAMEKIQNASTEGPQVFHWTHSNLEGDTFPCLVSLSAIPLKNRQLILAIGRDISELESARLDAEKANHAKSEFLANMSHEIRTPLNSMLGFTEVLLNKEQDQVKSRYIQNIHTSGNALLSLLNNVLDLSKLEVNKTHIQLQPCLLKQFLNELRSMFSYKALEQCIDFIIDVDDSLPKSFDLDVLHLRQVLLNLLSNALKFTENGHVSLHITGQLVDHKWELVFTVEDTGIGIGIAESQQEKVFNAFEQSAGQDESKYGGTGLGLAITNHLVSAMKGRLSLKSQLGAGSRFTVILPNIHANSIKPKEENESWHDSKDYVFKPAKVLITDDIELNRELLCVFLQAHPFDILTANNGQEMLDIAKKEKPDIILSDMKMPIMDGYEASKQLKQDQHCRHIPIIAVTASILDSDKVKLNHVCDGYLRKPISLNSVILELAKHLPHSNTPPPE